MTFHSLLAETLQILTALYTQNMSFWVLLRLLYINTLFVRGRPSLRPCFFVSLTLLVLSLCVPQLFWQAWLIFVFNPEYFLSVSFFIAPYPLSSICCSYQKDERAKSGKLPKSNALSEGGEYLVDKYFHFFHLFSVIPLLPTHCLGLFCLLKHMDTYTLSRTVRDEGSARSRHLYPTKYNTHKKQTSFRQVGFESTIPARERPRNYAVDRTGTEIFFPCWKQLIYCGVVSTHEFRTFLQYQCFIVRISIDLSLYPTLHDERKCIAVRWHVPDPFLPQVSSCCGASVNRETAFTFENMAWIYILSVVATRGRKVCIRK
jgi:hypothetical protein